MIVYPLLIGCYVLLIITTPTFEQFTQQTEFTDTGTIDYFSCHQHDCPTLLTTLLEESKTAECAFYELDTELIRIPDHANILKYDHGDSDSLSTETITPVPSKSLMHHKFCIFNNKTVLTGTWNPTYRGSYVNDNSVLLVRSSVIAGLYEKEYERLLSRTNNTKQKILHPTTPYTITLSNVTVRLSFSPQQQTEDLVADYLEKANASIKILSFMFTSDPLGKLLADKTDDVDIQGVFEATGTGTHSEYTRLREAGADVIKDGNPGFMHQKLIIVDSKVLIIGSYNPTKNARERNDENLLVIEDPNIVIDVGREYDRIRSQALVKAAEQ